MHISICSWCTLAKRSRSLRTIHDSPVPAAERRRLRCCMLNSVFIYQAQAFAVCTGPEPNPARGANEYTHTKKHAKTRKTTHRHTHTRTRTRSRKTTITDERAANEPHARALESTVCVGLFCLVFCRVRNCECVWVECSRLPFTYIAFISAEISRFLVYCVRI